MLHGRPGSYLCKLYNYYTLKIRTVPVHVQFDLIATTVLSETGKAIHQAALQTSFPAMMNLVTTPVPVIWLSLRSLSITQLHFSAADIALKCFQVFRTSNAHKLSRHSFVQQHEISSGLIAANSSSRLWLLREDGSWFVLVSSEDSHVSGPVVLKEDK